MFNEKMNNMDCNEFDNIKYYDFIDSAEKIMSSVIDVPSDIDKVLEMTPEESFTKKLALIESAKDMSTNEKIQAINEAENKRQNDIERNVETYKGLMWTKGAVVISVAFGGAWIASPKGQSIIKNFIKKIA